MKILHVINKCSHTSIPIEMAEIMAQKPENEVVIAAFYNSQKKAEEFFSSFHSNCTVIGCDYSNHKAKALKRLKEIIVEGKFDIVHTHHALSGALARWYAFGCGNTKVVHTVHADHHSFSTAQNMIIGSTLDRCDLIVSNSKSTEKGILEWQNRRIKNVKQQVIYNGIDTARIIHADNTFASEWLKKNEISQNTFIFSQIGRMEPVKNPILSLKGFDLFLQKLSKPEQDQVAFIFIGNGSEKSKLDQYLADKPSLQKRVFFTGTIMRDQVYSMLRYINTVVVPSHYEGFCNALFESMTAGERLCVSDIPVFHELIEDNPDILRFHAHDERKLAEDMMISYQNPFSEKEKTYWRNEAIQKFDVNICIEQYLRAYSDLVNNT